LCSLVCKHLHMATNLAIDPALLERALEVGEERTKRATVEQALREYVARREQRRIPALFHTLDWDPGYDPKSERSRK